MSRYPYRQYEPARKSRLDFPEHFRTFWADKVRIAAKNGWNLPRQPAYWVNAVDMSYYLKTQGHKLSIGGSTLRMNKLATSRVLRMELVKGVPHYAPREVGGGE